MNLQIHLNGVAPGTNMLLKIGDQPLKYSNEGFFILDNCNREVGDLSPAFTPGVYKVEVDEPPMSQEFTIHDSGAVTFEQNMPAPSILTLTAS